VRTWLAVVVIAAGCSSQPSDKEPTTPAAPSPAPTVVVDAAPLVVAVDAPPDAPAVAIVDAPMAWSAERERLTLEYRRQHSDEAATDLAIDPHVIVLHYTGGGSAASTRAYFDHTKIEAARKELARGGAVNVSSHFLVDRDGTIYRLQPETRFARHCIGLNHIAIGIENVGDEQRYPLTDAQVAADAALVRDLASRFHITHLLGHYEVMQFRDHPYFVELDPAYKNDKGDPGKAFMARVRERVADLKLSGL
jgi:N-acetyl-anhydromuramyl-L-alanine amidase AmpD